VEEEKEITVKPLYEVPCSPVNTSKRLLHILLILSVHHTRTLDRLLQLTRRCPAIHPLPPQFRVEVLQECPSSRDTTNLWERQRDPEEEEVREMQERI